MWKTNPIEAHRLWREGLIVADRSYSDQSLRMYASLFGRFYSWVCAHGKTLFDVEAHDIDGFLKSLVGRSGREASNRTMRAYLTEISKVMIHLEILGLRAKENPAYEIERRMKMESPLQARSIFMPAGADMVRHSYEQKLENLAPENLSPESVRAHAMNWLMLDAGLTLKEIQKLTLADLALCESDGVIHAPGHRHLPSRQIVLTSSAIRWLTAWLQIRSELIVVTPEQYAELKGMTNLMVNRMLPRYRGTALPKHLARVFVTIGGRADQPGGFREKAIAVNRLKILVVYESAQEVLGPSEVFPGGLDRHKGPQTLRNLCLARLVATGVPDDAIASQMGFLTLDQVREMRKALPATVVTH